MKLWKFLKNSNSVEKSAIHHPIIYPSNLFIHHLIILIMGSVKEKENKGGKKENYAAPSQTHTRN